MNPVPREGGRVLLLDPLDRVLLIHESIQDGSQHWLTPGGGLEPGETPAQAAAREAFEETGLRLDLAPDAGAVLTTRRRWSWDGVTYDQLDHFFLVRLTEAVTIAPGALTAMEQDTLIGFRWWSIPELRTSTETLVPADLGERLAALTE